MTIPLGQILGRLLCVEKKKTDLDMLIDCPSWVKGLQTL